NTLSHFFRKNLPNVRKRDGKRLYELCRSLTMEIESLFISLEQLGEGIALEIIPDKGSSCRILSDLEAIEHGECIYQIFEGHSYEYEFVGTEEYMLSVIIDGIVVPSRRNTARGRIVPKIYVGTLKLLIKSTASHLDVDEVSLEVIATKFDQSVDNSYR